jgi:hypothetical protein
MAGVNDFGQAASPLSKPSLADWAEAVARVLEFSDQPVSERFAAALAVIPPNAIAGTVTIGPGVPSARAASDYAAGDIHIDTDADAALLWDGSAWTTEYVFGAGSGGVGPPGADIPVSVQPTIPSPVRPGHMWIRPN